MNQGTDASTSDSQNRPRRNAPAYWVFLPGLLVSGWALSATLPRASFFHAQMGLAFLVFVPSFVGPIFVALRQRVAAAICAAVVVGSYWTLSLFLFFLYTRESVIGLLYIAQIFLPALAIALATIDSVNKRLGPVWAVGTAAVGSFSGILGAIFLLAAKSAELSYVRPLDPIALAPEMITINKCSHEFAWSHPESGYPESLGQLGPQGTGCISEVLMKGRVKEFTIGYEPGPRDANGKIASYTAKAQETSPKGPDVSSLLTDESGLIKYRYDGPHGKGSTDLYVPGEYLIHQSLDCLGNASISGPWLFIDGQEKTTITDPDEYFRRCVGKQYFAGERQFSQGGYGFEYNLVRDRRGTIQGYTLVVRPQVYGVAGIRSYLAIGKIDSSRRHITLHVYCTPQERPADVNDPLALAREIGMYGMGPLATTEH